MKKRMLLKSGCSGYTLIEMAIVIGVVGVLMASGAAAWRLHMKQQAYEATRDHLAKAAILLDTYLARFGRYPCPASLTVSRDSPEYGKESTVCKDGAESDDPPVAGTCLPDADHRGLCREKSQRTVQITDKDGNLKDIYPGVWRGAIPFRILNMSESEAMDGYGARLQYAVTERLATNQYYNKDQGGITIVGDRDSGGNNKAAFKPNSTVGAEDSAHFIVFSTGPDRKGGFSKDGKPIEDCDTSTLDGENCDSGKIVVVCDADTGECLPDTSDKAVYRSARYSEAPGVNHFDDAVKYYSSVKSPLWKTADQDGINIADVLGTGARIGIGMSPNDSGTLADSLKHVVDVNGDVRAQTVSGSVDTGRMKLDKLCDALAGGCFTPEKIAGDDPWMECDTGQSVLKVWGGESSPTQGQPAQYPSGKSNPSAGTKKNTYGEVACTAIPASSCPPGEYMVGAKDSKIICKSTNPPCPATVVPVCPGTPDKTIPASDSGSPALFYPMDDPTHVWYAVLTGDATPDIPGDYTMTDYYRCEGGNWVYQGDNWGEGGICDFPPPPEPEVCTPIPVEDESQNCYEAYSDWCGWGVDGFDRDGVETECKSGTFTGTVINTTEYVCPDGPDGGGYWIDKYKSDNCKCQSGVTDTNKQDCGFGYTGKMTQTRTWTCSDTKHGSWGGWSSWNKSACTCKAQTETQTVSCPEGYTGSIKQQRSIVCTSGAPETTDWTEISNNCVCLPGQQQSKVESCQLVMGSGYVGNIYSHRTFDCSTSKWSGWVEDSRTCAVGSHSWTPTSAPSASAYQTNPGFPAVGDVCSLGQSGKCETLTAAGYVVYNSCSCN